MHENLASFEIECLPGLELDWSVKDAHKYITETLGDDFQTALNNIFDPILDVYQDEIDWLEYVIEFYQEQLNKFYECLFTGALLVPACFINEPDILKKLERFTDNNSFYVEVNSRKMRDLLNGVNALKDIDPRISVGILKPIAKALRFHEIPKGTNYFYTEAQILQNQPQRNRSSTNILQNRIVGLIAGFSKVHGISFVRQRTRSLAMQDFNKDLARIALAYAMNEQLININSIVEH